MGNTCCAENPPPSSLVPSKSPPLSVDSETKIQAIIITRMLENEVDEVREFLETCQEDGRDLIADWDFNTVDNYNLTLLYKLCRNGWSEMVRLIGDRCDWNDAEIPQIHTACQYCDRETVQFGIEQCGANYLQISPTNTTTLIHASKSGNFEVVEYLCGLDGVDASFVNRQDRWQQSALYFACLNDHCDVVRILIEKGANPNLPTETGTTPFFVACRNGLLSEVQLLMESNCGTDPRVENNVRCSPLLTAVIHGHMKIVKYLVNECNYNHDGYVTQWRSIDGVQFAHFAVAAGRLDILEFLVETCQLDLHDSQNEKRLTPLHDACFHGRDKLARYLVESGVNVTALNADGKTSIELAREKNHHELASMLEKVVGGDDEKKLDEFPVETLSRLGLKTGENEWISKWIPIMKRNEKNWKGGLKVYGQDLLKELLVIEEEFRSVDVSDGHMNTQLMDCVDRHRPEILRIFGEIQSLYRQEIQLCKDDPEYLAFLDHFMTRSREFGKFEGSARIYDAVHENELAKDARYSTANPWHSCVELIDIVIDERKQGKNVRYYQPHRDDIVLLWAYALVTQQKLNRFLTKFARLTDGHAYLEKGVKSLFRIQEKMCVKFNWMKRYDRPDDPTMVWDYVRGMVSYSWLHQIPVAMVDFLLNRRHCGEIYVFNIWNRFTEESNGQWQDVMVHFYFKDIEEEHRVICEVQLCVKGFTKARKSFGGHDAYANYRNAEEIKKCVKFES